MIIWILAVVVLGLVAAVGYYQGAIRALFSLVGLVVAAWLAMPLESTAEPLVKLFTKSPFIIPFVAPLVVFLVVLIVFKVFGYLVHRQANLHYKYREADTRYMLWQRVNRRLGLCVGLINGGIYVFLLCILAYVFGYVAIQTATADTDPVAFRFGKTLAEGLQETKMDQAVAPFDPAEPFFYQWADVAGDLINNPLIVKRLSDYPPFLTLASRPEFQAIAGDKSFREFIAKHPNITDYMSNEKVKAILLNPDLLHDIWAQADDVPDLLAFLETGKSEKYDEEKILGRWYFDLTGAMYQARKLHPELGGRELRGLKSMLEATESGATLVAMPNNQLILKYFTPPDKAEAINGTWKSLYDAQYMLTLPKGGRNYQVPASVEVGHLLMASPEGLPLSFEK